MIEFLASQPHYREHLQPIADELGGTFVSRLEASYGKGLLVVASQRDLFVGRRPAVFVEHGAGQTYSDANPGYPGGEHRENVRLFVCPSERVADLNRQRYPEARYAVVGCPKLDRYAGRRLHGQEVAVAFHWPCGVSPEAGTAYPHYSGALYGLVSRFGRVLGHGHPRVMDALTGPYRAAGIEPVLSLEEVFERASVLVVDNSSIGWEAMALGIPVVWMNAPWYRRHVEHGLRFWEFADAGVQVNEPEELIDGIEEALVDIPQVRERRREAVEAIYGSVDGKAAHRAALAIRELMEA